MFFNSVEEIVEIAGRTSCAVFVVPKDLPVEIKNAIILQPEGKSVISVEQVRELIPKLSIRRQGDLFVVIRPAELLKAAAANAFLKSLEEPSEGVHFILITDEPSSLLPTVLSRSAIYFLWREYNDEILADKKVMEAAKKLIVVRPADLVTIAEELSKKKDGVRAYVLTVLSVAIEMLYKSYYKTGKEAFILKLPKFLKAYENIERNGHIKLHLVADLM